MASWLGGGGGGGKGNPAGSGGKLVPPPPSKTSKKRERWLVTRKTWRYMADAGKLLIPEYLRKGKDYKDYTEDDIRLLEEHFHDVCEQQKEFVIWEGPVEDPRVQLAKTRKAPSSASTTQFSESQADSLVAVESAEESSDYRYESHAAKFRIVLPSGEKPPPGYTQVGTRSFNVGDVYDADFKGVRRRRLPTGLVVQELPAQLLQAADGGDWSFSDSSPLDSGILSPSGEFMLSPRDHSPSCSDEDYKPDLPTRESGIGSGLDNIAFSNKRNMIIQTDPLPPEFYELQVLEGREEREEAVLPEEEDLKIAEETPALAKRELQRRHSEVGGSDYDPATMGETVMRYLKMVRRNSKTLDQKKAERFRSMNYDPTLRNIKAKQHPLSLGGHGEVSKHTASQCGESLIRHSLTAFQAYLMITFFFFYLNI